MLVVSLLYRCTARLETPENYAEDSKTLFVLNTSCFYTGYSLEKDRKKTECLLN